jgi:putative ABC transport system ATP-binding protein
MTDSSPAAAAAAHGVSVTYQTAGEVVAALQDVSVVIEAAATTALSGPSGSGKSTLLRLFALFERPTSGTVCIGSTAVENLREGERRRVRRRSIAFVHQRPLNNLVSDLRVEEQIQFARRLRGLQPIEPSTLLVRFGLARVSRSWPAELSGGEQQRLAFAMAVAGDPQLILADEPTAELDRHHAMEVVETIGQLSRSGVSTVVASHDPAVVSAADHVIELRDGMLVARG